MSICPNNDIHSVYLDNELPLEYKTEYESHIAICPECTKKLEQLKAVRKMFIADSASLTPDSHYCEQSYDRLMLKMRFNANSKTAWDKKSIKSYLNYFVPAIAAAAVFAIVLPLRIVKGNVDGINVPVNTSASMVSSMGGLGTYVNSPMPTVTALGQSNKVSLNSGRSIVISGNIEESFLCPEETSFVNLSRDFVGSNNMIQSVEVIKPNLSKNETISIRITIPGLEEPAIAEFSMPLNVYSGKN